MYFTQNVWLIRIVNKNRIVYKIRIVIKNREFDILTTFPQHKNMCVTVTKKNSLAVCLSRLHIKKVLLICEEAFVLPF